MFFRTNIFLEVEITYFASFFCTFDKKKVAENKLLLTSVLSRIASLAPSLAIIQFDPRILLLCNKLLSASSITESVSQQVFKTRCIYTKTDEFSLFFKNLKLEYVSKLQIQNQNQKLLITIYVSFMNISNF